MTKIKTVSKFIERSLVYPNVTIDCPTMLFYEDRKDQDLEDTIKEWISSDEFSRKEYRYLIIHSYPDLSNKTWRLMVSLFIEKFGKEIHLPRFLKQYNITKKDITFIEKLNNEY